MVTFELAEQIEHILIYHYFPENKRDAKCGVITVNLQEESIEITELAEKDWSRTIPPEELNTFRDSINAMRAEDGKPPLTEDELPTATEPCFHAFYGSHAVSRIGELIEDGEIPQRGSSAWY